MKEETAIRLMEIAADLVQATARSGVSLVPAQKTTGTTAKRLPAVYSEYLEEVKKHYDNLTSS